MEQSQNISEMNNDITERVQQVLQQIKEYILKFNGFSHLWEDDKKEYLAQFLKYGRQLSQEEIDAKFTGLEIPEKPPTIEQFEETVIDQKKFIVELQLIITCLPICEHGLFIQPDWPIWELVPWGWEVWDGDRLR